VEPVGYLGVAEAHVGIAAGVDVEEAVLGRDFHVRLLVHPGVDVLPRGSQYLDRQNRCAEKPSRVSHVFTYSPSTSTQPADCGGTPRPPSLHAMYMTGFPVGVPMAQSMEIDDWRPPPSR